MSKQLESIDLFTGIGGFKIACDWLGIKTKQFVEIDANCRKVLKKHYPDVPIHDDVTTYHPIRADVIIGGSPCFIDNTLVLTSKGFIPIAELVIGDLVLTHKGRWRKVTAIGSTESQTLAVKARGIETITTANHPFFTTKRFFCYRNGAKCRAFGQNEWVEAGRLNNDHFLLNILPPEVEATIDNETLWLLGRYVADGYLQERKDRPSGGSVTFCIGKAKLDIFLSHLDKYHSNTQEERTAFKCRITNNALYFLCKEFKKGAEGKELPSWILALPEHQARIFLDGYLSGDGSIFKGGVRATTVSKKLAFCLMILFQRVFKTVPSIHFSARANKTIIEGREVNQKNTYTVQTSVTPSFKTINFVKDEYGCFQVKSVKTTGNREKVYNISVEEDESYTANGAIVHNCQGNSVAGNKKGLEDSRSSLWFEQFRIIKEGKPDFAVWENPKGALYSGALERVLNDLDSIDYQCDAEIVSAKEVGLPQLRERIFVVSYSNRIQQAIRGKVLCSWTDQIRDHINQARSFGSPQESQPPIRRVADGVSDRLQRGRQLGNAVVPQCAVVPLLRVKYLSELAA